MGPVELWHSIDGWVVLAAIALPVLAKITIVCVALRGAEPADRPRIISALAELFRWWRRPGESGRHE